MVNFKGLTVKQPYAQLLAIGAKQYETRSKSTRYRGPVVIHAGKDQLQYNVVMQDTEITYDWAWWHTRRDAIYAAAHAAGLLGPVPFGAIIAYAEIVGCYPVDEIANVTEREKMFGDWSEGRYAWEIQHAVMIEQPIAYRGQLGLWNVPEEIIKRMVQMEQTRI